MKKPEWNEFFAWMLAMYPQWKPDALTSAAWFDELGPLASSVAELKAAVRKVHTARPTPFPPSALELSGALQKRESPKLRAAGAWMTARHIAQGRTSSEDAYRQDPTLGRVISLLGGIDVIGFCDEEKRPFLERRFCELYKSSVGEVTELPALGEGSVLAMPASRGMR